jgi:hypothetical protein
LHGGVGGPPVSAGERAIEADLADHAAGPAGGPATGPVPDPVSFRVILLRADLDALAEQLDALSGQLQAVEEQWRVVDHEVEMLRGRLGDMERLGANVVDWQHTLVKWLNDQRVHVVVGSVSSCAALAVAVVAFWLVLR